MLPVLRKSSSDPLYEGRRPSAVEVLRPADHATGARPVGTPQIVHDISAPEYQDTVVAQRSQLRPESQLYSQRGSPSRVWRLHHRHIVFGIHVEEGNPRPVVESPVTPARPTARSVREAVHNDHSRKLNTSSKMVLQIFRRVRYDASPTILKAALTCTARHWIHRVRHTIAIHHQRIAASHESLRTLRGQAHPAFPKKRLRVEFGVTNLTFIATISAYLAQRARNADARSWSQHTIESGDEH